MESSAMPTDTASPWRSSWCESCSSLCAAQWPKSSGRDEPSSNGSPLVAMWFRCSSALRCTSRAIASSERSRDRARDARSTEERRVLEQRDLDRLRDAGAPVAVGQRVEQVEVVEHRVRRRERPDEVLLPERVDAVLDADRRVVLREDGGRDADQPHAAVGGRGGVADGIEHGAAADRHHVGVAVDAVDVDRGADLVAPGPRWFLIASPPGTTSGGAVSSSASACAAQ